MGTTAEGMSEFRVVEGEVLDFWVQRLWRRLLGLWSLEAL